MKLLKNHRYLKDGEIIKRGDLYYEKWEKVWLHVNRRHFEKPFIKKLWGSSILCTKLEIEKVLYSEDDKNFILKKLKKERALNGDSALKIKGVKFPLCYTLAKDKIISVIDDNRFYLNNIV